MPFYEYLCKQCGHELEAMQKINDAPLKKCPECGKSALDRLMSAPVFRLKGAGWYETDFKSDQEGKRNLAEKPEAEPAKEEKGKDDQKAGADGKAKDATVSKDAAAGQDGGGKESKKAAEAAGGAGGSRSAEATPAGKSSSKSAVKPVAKPAARPSSAAKPAARGGSKKSVKPKAGKPTKRGGGRR